MPSKFIIKEHIWKYAFLWLTVALFVKFPFILKVFKYLILRLYGTTAMLV